MNDNTESLFEFKRLSFIVPQDVGSYDVGDPKGLYQVERDFDMRVVLSRFLKNGVIPGNLDVFGILVDEGYLTKISFAHMLVFESMTGGQVFSTQVFDSGDNWDDYPKKK